MYRSIRTASDVVRGEFHVTEVVRVTFNESDSERFGEKGAGYFEFTAAGEFCGYETRFDVDTYDLTDLSDFLSAAREVAMG